MTTIVPFAGSSNVPAFVKAAQPGNLADISIGLGFPVVSIKGKVFTLKDGDDSKLITKPGTDEPASSLEVVILDVGPSADLKFNSRIFYAKGFEEGSNAKPDCYSNDGVEPGADAQNKQAEKCALCKHNAKGSGSTGVGKACRSSKRMAIATPDNLDNPMLLRVPGDSLMAFSDYIKWMKKSGVSDTAHVVTKIGFDYSVAHPALTFKGLGWATQDPAEAKATDTVGYITGKKAMPTPEVEVEEPFETPAPAFVKKEEPAKVEAPKKAKPAPVVEDDDLPSEPKVKTEVKVEAAPKSAVPKADPVTVVDDDLDAALDDFDFDA